MVPKKRSSSYADLAGNSSIFFGDDEVVFKVQTLDAETEDASTFVEDVWDGWRVFEWPPNTRKGQTKVAFDLNDHWKLSVKEISMALFNPLDLRVAANGIRINTRPASIGLVRSRVAEYRRLQKWQEEHCPNVPFESWSVSVWREVFHFYLDKGLSRGSMADLVVAIRDLWRFRGIQTNGGLSKDPFDGQSIAQLTARTVSGTTRVLPPAVWEPLLVVSSKYVFEFSQSILRLRDTHRCERRESKRSGAEGRSEVLERQLKRYLLEKGPIPVVLGDGVPEPDWTTLSQLVTGNRRIRAFFGTSDGWEGQTYRSRRSWVLERLTEARVVSDWKSSDTGSEIDDRWHSGWYDPRSERVMPAESRRLIAAWLAHDESAVPVYEDLEDEERITEPDVNWSLLERLILGDRHSGRTHGLFYTSANVSRRAQFVDFARSGRFYKCPVARNSLGSLRKLKQWHEPRVQYLTDNDARNELRALRAACYIYIGTMTMMRDSELQFIERNSVTSFMGYPAIKSKIVKGRSAPEPAKWWITPKTAEVISVLEELSCDDEYLFGDYVAGDREAQAKGMNAPREINWFISHCNSTSVHGELPEIPVVRINSRMLRRTSAAISGELGGSELALAQQLQHATGFAYVNATTSYMAPDPAWSKELSRNSHELSLEKMSKMLDGGQASLAGLGGKALAEILEKEGKSEAQGPEFRGIVLETAEVQKILRRVAPQIHFGPTNACLFDPSKALCSVNLPDGESPRALLGACQPSKCRNAVIAESHRPVWIAEGDALKASLKSPGINELRRMTIEERLREVEGVLADLDHPEGPE